jgi:hypothetical protein
MYMYMYIYIYVYIYTYVYIYIHISVPVPAPIHAIGLSICLLADCSVMHSLFTLTVNTPYPAATKSFISMTFFIPNSSPVY